MSKHIAMTFIDVRAYRFKIAIITIHVAHRYFPLFPYYRFFVRWHLSIFKQTSLKLV